MKILNHFWLLFIFTNLNNSMEIWKDNFLDYDDFNNFEEANCLDTETGPNNFEDLMKRNEVSTIAEDLDEKQTRVASFHASHPLPCSCGIEFRLKDLGAPYYPRYIHNGFCKSKGCGGLYRCVERHYNVKVLKKKDSRSSKKSLALPEGWQSEIISVTVACECSL